MNGDVNNTDLKRVITDGVKTEFWRLLCDRLEETKKAASQRLTSGRVDSLDGCIELSKFNAIFKTADELQNWPKSVLVAIETQERLEAKHKPADK